MVYSNGNGALLYLVGKGDIVFFLNLVYRKSNPVIQSGIEFAFAVSHFSVLEGRLMILTL